MLCLHREKPGNPTPPNRPLAVFLFFGVMLFLAVVACDMESYEATRAVEDATKEVEKALDDRRKDADLPSCKDARTNVYIVSERNGPSIEKIDDYDTLKVVANSEYARIDCTGVATYKNGHSEPITYWVRKNAGMAKGNYLAGFY